MCGRLCGAAGMSIAPCPFAQLGALEELEVAIFYLWLFLRLLAHCCVKASAILVGPLGKRRNTMRKLLLVGASLLALGTATAFAKPKPKGPEFTLDAYLAAALATNQGGVAGNHSRAFDQTNSTQINSSYNGTKGVSNQNQNAGANSALQNSLSLAYVQGCNCANTNANPIQFAAGLTLAGAGNRGEVENNHSSTGTSNNEDWFSFGPVTNSASISGSYNSSTGVLQVNQNSGDNSLLQNSAAVAAAGPFKGEEATLAAALAVSGNKGEVERNHATSLNTTTRGDISNSFDGTTGVVNANQNVAANSQLQNATAVAVAQLCSCTTTSDITLAAAVAASNNHGGVWDNHAATSFGSNSATMSNSFNSSQGMLQSSQNAGANSLMQNSVSVGAVIHQ